MVDFFSGGMGPHGNNHKDKYTPGCAEKPYELQLIVLLETTTS
jgi:hypothetical protein